MNTVSLVGRITKTPEVKVSNSGTAVCAFTIAINRIYGNRETDFINCVAFGKQAENMASFVTKGQQIGVEGRIQSRTYETNSGEKRYVTEVIANTVQFLERRDDNNTPAEQPLNQNPNSYNIQNPEMPNLEISDDELPF